MASSQNKKYRLVIYLQTGHVWMEYSLLEQAKTAMKEITEYPDRVKYIQVTETIMVHVPAIQWMKIEEVNNDAT